MGSLYQKNGRASWVWEAETGRSEFKASLLYTLQRSSRATQRSPVGGGNHRTGEIANVVQGSPKAT